MDYAALQEAIRVHFWNGWDAPSQAIVGYEVPVFWDKEPQSVPDVTKGFLRFTFRFLSEQQRGIGSCHDGSQYYQGVGLVWIQFFFPESLPDQYCLELAGLAVSIFRGQRVSVAWFHDVSLKDVQSEDEYKRFDVLAETRYEDRG